MLSSQLRSGRLPLRLLRQQNASTLSRRRFAHVVADSPKAPDDPPPAAPSPYNKDFTESLSGPATPSPRTIKRRLKKKAAREARRLKAALSTLNEPSSEPQNVTPDQPVSEPSTSKEIFTRLHAVLKTKSQDSSDLLATAKAATAKAPASLRGEQFWKADWGEDKLKPSKFAAKPPAKSTKDQLALDFGVATPLRVVRGFIPYSKSLSMQDLSPTTEQRPVARLAHGLDRALFNPGVYWVKDPRSRVYNFNPYVEEVPDVREFDFARVAGFIKSSRDEDLLSLAKQHKARFAGSTSSLTGMLSQIYLALSRARDVNTSVLSEAFLYESRSFSYAQKIPVSVVLWHRDGVYTTDSYSHDPTSDKNILMWMGTMLEKFLTLPEDDFRHLLRSSPPITETDNRKEAYRYAKIGAYITRAQLDCYDPRVPGSGIFDIKTRACLPIRKDVYNWEENSGYLIKKSQGLLESFEREYYDLITSAFLKFSLQARIGNMDGMFITYHNTERIFGVQYVPLEEMDERLYGNSAAGPLVFDKCMQILEATMLEIVHHFPVQNIECIFEAVPSKGQVLVWASPLKWDGPKEEKPIVELAVKLQNVVSGKYLDGEYVADKIPDEPWTVMYNIVQSPDTFEDIRQRADAALDRQLLPWKLPHGVGIKQMAEIWEAMDFGGGDLQASKSVFHPDRFKKADANVLALRRVARRGREETKAIDELYAGQKKVVWGEPIKERSEVAQSVPKSANTVEERVEAKQVEVNTADTVAERPETDNELKGVVEAETAKTQESPQGMDAPATELTNKWQWPSLGGLFNGRDSSPTPPASGSPGVPEASSEVPVESSTPSDDKPSDTKPSDATPPSKPE